MPDAQIVLPDGRVELGPDAPAADPSLTNADLAPTPISARKWTTYNYAALWIGIAHCVPTYMLAASLIATGMVWWEALLTIGLGNVIVLVPILLNSHPGTRYGIPFPVFARASYGIYGANVPAMMRAIVACGWFGINTWWGGEAVQIFLTSIFPAWPTALGAARILGFVPSVWFSFFLFWLLNVAIIYKGMDLLRVVENWAAPFVLVMTSILLGWMIWRAHGLGPIVTTRAHPPGFSFWKIFPASLTAMIGFWATLSLNMPDFTRYGKSQRQQLVGQVVGLPSTMTIFSAMAILITSAASVIYGESIWDPMKLVAKFPSRAIVAVAMFTIVVATLSVNIAANVVSPANDLANLAPKRISFFRGGLLTAIAGVAMMPWKLVENQDKYIYGWLLGYSGGLGAIAGVLVTDYWIVRRTHLRLADLYRKDGIYRFNDLGTHWAAIGATLLGCACAWIGLFVPALRRVYDYAWFVGAGVAAVTYYVASRGRSAGDASLRPRSTVDASR